MKFDEMIEDLLGVDEGLTEWEVEFIESMGRRLEERRGFSDKEKAKIEELYDKHC